MRKVVTQRCLEQDLNPRPTDRKPKCLTRCTTAPPKRLLRNNIKVDGATHMLGVGIALISQPQTIQPVNHTTLPTVTFPAIDHCSFTCTKLCCTATEAHAWPKSLDKSGMVEWVKTEQVCDIIIMSLPPQTTQQCIINIQQSKRHRLVRWLVWT